MISKSTGRRTKNFINRIRLFRSEPLLYAFYMLFIWIFIKIKSYVCSIIFKADGIIIGPRSIIRGSSYMSFGSNISINGDLWLEAVHTYRGQIFDPFITLGDHLSISKNVHITCINKISIGANVLIGSQVYISDHNHGSYVGSYQSHPSEPPADRLLVSGGPVQIGSNVWIGDNVVIVGPAIIGEGAIIAANSFVKGDIPAKAIVAGAPARIIKHFDEHLGVWTKI